jgi:cell division protein FtsA
MKVMFGSALAEEAQKNAFISIPSLRGLPSKNIAVKNLAAIIQARMTEILEFVSYNLKQVGLDNRSLNGGIVLTGGGSQLKHLIQLTEYVTGLNARIGYPHEHLMTGHIEELSKPMYSTCIGLILKGYNVYENSQNRLIQTLNPFEQPAASVIEVPENPDGQVIIGVPAGDRKKSLKGFMDKIKSGIIDLFKEEAEDTRF